MLKIRSFVNATATAVLSMTGVLSAHAGAMVSVTSPIPGTAVQGTTPAASHVASGADPSTLKIEANGAAAAAAPATSPAPSPSTPGLVFTSPGFGGTVTGSSITVAVQVSLQEDTASLKVKLNGQDISARLHSSSCNANSCTMQGTVATQDGLKKGQNLLSASVSGLAGAAGSVQRSTFDYQLEASTGDGGNTIQYYEPVSVGITTLNAGGGNPWIQITTGSTMNVNDPVQSFPALHDANGVISVPYSDIQYGTDCTTSLQAIALNRQTPSVMEATGCGDSVSAVETDLASGLGRGLNSSDLVVLGTTPTNVVNQTAFDATSLGGGLYVLGAPTQPVDYPQEYMIIGVPGATPGTAHESYDVQTSTSAPRQYAPFLNGTLMMDQNSNYNYVPSDDRIFQVSSNATASSINVGGQQYTAPSTGGSGAFWLLVLDRELLQPVNLPSAGAWTTCPYDGGWGPPAACGGIFNVNTDGGFALAQVLGTISPRDMIFLVAQGCPYGGLVVPSLPAAALPALGAPGYSLFALNAQSNTCAFSLVSVNDGKHTNVLTTPAALSANQYSAQGQTGSIHGFLARTKSGLFDVAGKDQVAALDTGLTPTVDYTFEQTASAQRVEWPLTDTPGHLAAYHDISFQLLNDPSINESGSYLYDVRYFYTNSAIAKNLTALIDSRLSASATNPVSQKLSDQTATPQDFADARSEILAELQALNSSMGYLTSNNGVESLLNGAQLDIFASIFATAADISTDAANADKQSVDTSGSNFMSMATGLVSIAGSIAGVDFPPVGAFLGVMSAVMSTGSATAASSGNNIPGPQSPYDFTVSQLLVKDFSPWVNNLMYGFDGAVDNIFSDPGKLATIGALTSNSDSGWNIANLSVSTELKDSIVAGGTRSMWLDVLPALYGVRQFLAMPNPDPATYGSWVTSSYSSICTSVYSNSGPGSGIVPSASLADYPSAILPNTFDTYIFAEGPTVQIPKYQYSIQDYAVSANLSNILLNAPGLNIGPAFLLSNASPLTVGPGAYFDYSGLCIIGDAGLTGPTRQSPTATQLAVDSSSIGTVQQLQVTVTVKSTDQSQNDMSGTIVLSANGKTVGTLQIPAKSAGTATVTSTMDGSALPLGTSGLTAAYSGDSGYLASSSNAVEVTTGAPSFALAAQDDVLALLSAPGSQIGTDVTLTPDFGFNAAVQLSCSGLPANMSCSFDKSQLTVNGTPASAHVTFTNNGTAQAALDTKQISGRGLGVLACGLVGLCFIRRRSRLVMLVGLVMIGSFLGGCGSSPSVQNPPTGSYTVNVKATGGGVTQTSKVVLNIQ